MPTIWTNYIILIRAPMSNWFIQIGSVQNYTVSLAHQRSNQTILQSYTVSLFFFEVLNSSPLNSPTSPLLLLYSSILSHPASSLLFLNSSPPLLLYSSILSYPASSLLFLNSSSPLLLYSFTLFYPASSLLLLNSSPLHILLLTT